MSEDYTQQASYDATFEVGDRVRMVGLLAAAKYNGVTGKVAGLDGADRYVVKLDPGKIDLRVRPNNIMKIDHDTPSQEAPAALPRPQTGGSPFVPPAAPGMGSNTEFTPRPAPPHPTPSSNFPRSNPQQPNFSPSFNKPLPPDLSRGSPAVPQPQFEDTPAPPMPPVPVPPTPDYASDPTYIVRPPPPIQRANRTDQDYSETPKAGIHAILAEVKAPSGERHVLIEDLLEGGQLERKGVRKMDRIVEVQGRSASSMSLRQLQGMIPGNEGSKVELTVQHPASQTGPSPPFTINVTRTFSQTADALVIFHEELEALVRAPLEQAKGIKPLARLPPHIAAARTKLHSDILQLKASQADLLAQHGTLKFRLDQASRDNNHLNTDLQRAEEEARALRRANQDEKVVQTRMARDFDTEIRHLKTGTSDLGGCLAALRLRPDAPILSPAPDAAFHTPAQVQEQEKHARRTLAEEVAAAIDTDQERVDVIGMRPDQRVVDLILFPPSERCSDLRPALELAQEVLRQAGAEGSALRRSAVTNDVEGVEVKAGQGWLSYLRAKMNFLEDNQRALREESKAKDVFVQQAKREVQAMEEKVGGMQRALDKLQAQLKVERDEAMRLQRENAAVLMEMEKMRQELAGVREEVFHDDVLQSKERRMQAAEAAQAALLRDMEEMRAEFEAQKRSADKALADAIKVRDEATDRADSLVQTSQKLKDQVQTQKQQYSSLQSMYELEISRREHAETKRDELQEQLTSNQEAFFQLKVEHEKGKAKLKERDERITHMNSREANLKEATRALQHTIEDLRQRNQALNGVPHVEVQKMLADHNALVASKNAKIDELEQRILEVDTAMADLNRQLFEAPLTMEEKSKFEIKSFQHAKHHAALTEQLDWRTAEVVSLRQQIRSFLSNSGAATLENQKVISEQHRTISIQQRELEKTKAALAEAEGALEEKTKERQAALDGLLDVMLREENRSKDPQQWLHRDAGERYRRNEQQMKMMVETYEEEVKRLSRRVVQLEAPVLENWDSRIAAALLSTNRMRDQDEVGGDDDRRMDPEGWKNKMPSLSDHPPPPSPFKVPGTSSEGVPGTASAGTDKGGRSGELIEVEVMRGVRRPSTTRDSEEAAEAGVGVYLAQPCVVMAVKDGSAAQRSGEIRPGDFLQKIDGQPTKGIGGTELARKLVGPVGTTVRLTLFRMSDTTGSPIRELEE